MTLHSILLTATEFNCLSAYPDPLRVLAAHKRKAHAELKEKFPKVLKKACFKFLLPSILCEGEKVEVVGIFKNLLRKVRLWWREGSREVCLGFPLSAVKAALDLMSEDVPAPPMLQRGPCVPFPLFGIFHEVKDAEVVPPPYLSNNLLDK